MKQYHKIQTVFKRDPETKHKTLLDDEYSLPEFEYLKNNKWIFTEKVDGTNIRIMYKDGIVTFGGKTDRAMIPARLVERLNEKFLPMQEKFDSVFGHDVCFYGEGYGPKIQKGGGNYGDHQDFVLFDIKIGEFWLQRNDIEKIAEKLNIDVVPIMGYGALLDMVEYARAGISSTWGDFQAEGFVAKPEIELQTRAGGRIITKIKCKDFRL